MRLSTVQEIEQALSELAPQELNEITLWLDRRYSEMMEARFRSDLDEGKLDGAIHRALEDDDAGRTRSL